MFLLIPIRKLDSKSTAGDSVPVRVRSPAPYRVFITDLTVVDTRFFVFSLGRVMCRQKSAHFFAYYHSRNNNLGIGKYKKSLLVVEMISKGVYTEL